MSVTAQSQARSGYCHLTCQRPKAKGMVPPQLSLLASCVADFIMKEWGASVLKDLTAVFLKGRCAPNHHGKHQARPRNIPQANKNHVKSFSS